MRKEYKEYKPTGIDWISQIPAHWKVSPIKRIFDVFTGATPDSNKPEYWDGNIVWITPADFNSKQKYIHTGKKFITKEGYLSCATRLVPSESIIFSKRAPVGKVVIAKKEMCTSQGCLSCVKKQDSDANELFFYYSFLIIEKWFNAIAAGTTFNEIGTAVFSNTKILVPPRKEQDQIVRFLDWKVSSINKLIKIKHEQLNAVKELLNSVFSDISSESCKRVKIKHLFKLENDFFIPDSFELYSKAGMYNCGRGIFFREQCLGNELGASRFQHIHPDCLMLSGQFAWENAVYITQEKDTVGIASHRYYLLKPTKYVSVEYLWAYFLSYEGFFNLQQCSHGSAGRNRPLNIKEVLDLELPVSDDLGAVRTLNKLVRYYMRLQAITENERTNLVDLRTRLIADVVTGKIDVRGINVPEYEHVDGIADNGSEDALEEEEDFKGEAESVCLTRKTL